MALSFSDLNQFKLRPQFRSHLCELLYWGFFDGSSWWRNYLHEHSFYEVCYVLQGEGIYTVNQQQHIVKSGDVFLAKPSERHEIIASHSDPLAIYFWSYTLVPRPFLQDDLGYLLEAFRHSEASVVQSEHCWQWLHLLEQELLRQEASYPLMLDTLCTQLIIEVARTFAQLPRGLTRDHQSSYHHAVVDTIIRYLRDNYQQTMHLKEIAAQVHLSERHMSRVFKDVTGQSIKQYLTKVRLEMAKQLLLDQQLSISEVAYQTGFEDVRYFSTLFRKHLGLRPTDFRAKGGTEFL